MTAEAGLYAGSSPSGPPTLLLQVKNAASALLRFVGLPAKL